MLLWVSVATAPSTLSLCLEPGHISCNHHSPGDASGVLRSWFAAFCTSSFSCLRLTLWLWLWGSHPLPGQSCPLGDPVHGPSPTLCSSASFPPVLEPVPFLRPTQGCRDVSSNIQETHAEVQPTFLLLGTEATLSLKKSATLTLVLSYSRWLLPRVIHSWSTHCL